MSAKRHSRLTIVLAVALLAAFALGAMAQDDDNVKKGLAAMKAKRYTEATSLFRTVTQDYPDWSYGYFFLGLSLKYNRDYDSAIAPLKRSLDLAGNENELFGASMELADTYYRKGDYRNAVKYILEAKKYKSASKYRANVKNIRLIEGISRYHLQQYQQAIDIFAPDMSSGNANANILRTVAKCYQSLNNNAKAVEVIDLAVKKDPSDLAAHLILVKSYLNDEKWREALTSSDYALEHHAGNWELHYLKGRALYKLGRHNDSIASLTRSIGIRHVDKTAKLLGDAYRDSGQFLKATDAYNTAQRSYARDPSFFTTFAFCWYQFVPKDAEKYHGTSDQTRYLQALDNARTLLEAAEKLQGANRQQITSIMDGINNKRERLEKGETITEEYVIEIDPETGEVIKRKVEDKK